MNNRKAGLLVLVILVVFSTAIAVADTYIRGEMEAYHREFDGTFSQFLGNGQVRIINDSTMEELMNSEFQIVEISSTDLDYSQLWEPGDEIVRLYAATYADAIQFFPDEAVSISVLCSNPGEPYTEFNFDDAQLIPIASSICSGMEQFWIIYIYPGPYTPGFYYEEGHA